MPISHVYVDDWVYDKNTPRQSVIHGKSLKSSDYVFFRTHAGELLKITKIHQRSFKAVPVEVTRKCPHPECPICRGNSMDVKINAKDLLIVDPIQEEKARIERFQYLSML